MKLKNKILICFLILAGLVLGGLYWYYSTTYIRIEGKTLRRDIIEYTVTGDQLPETRLLEQLLQLESLDVRSVPVSVDEYTQLTAALPNCRILWRVPFQGNSLPEDTAEITVTGTQLPQMEALQYLPYLRLLDLRGVGVSISEYEQLKTDLPNCQILWNVPFQGAYLAEDTSELTVASVSAEDLASIPYLPALKTVTADGCRDYAVLMQLIEQYPNLSVHYTITVDGKDYSHDTETLELPDANIESLSAVIPYLPQLKQVTFTGTAPDNEAIYQLMCEYPEVSFFWNLTLFGIETPNTAQELDLSGIAMKDTSEIESYLKYFPNLKRVDMCDCGIGSAEMDALSQRWPNTRFIWKIKLGNGTVRTDAIGFMPRDLNYTKENPFYDEDCTELKYCTDLICLDLGHMQVTDLSFLNYMPKLKYLIIADIPCQDFSPIANLKDLIYLEIFMVTFPHQEILLELKNLQDLNMSITTVEDIEIIKQMTWLKRFWAFASGVTAEQADELRAALPDTVIKTYLRHSTDGGWRKHQNYYDMRDILGVYYMD